MNDLFKKAIAEVVGTFVLVFVACGVAALTGGDIVPTSLAFGLVIVAMAYSVGRVSGCHINPAVSLGCLLTKRMTIKEFLVYVCAQIVGGFLGAALIFGIMKMAGMDVGATAASNLAVNYDAAKGLAAGNIIGALLTEAVLTCIFVYVILNVTSENSGAGKKAGLIIGLTLTLVHLIGIPLTGTSVNPARSLATALGNLIYTGDATALSQVWIFVVGPLLGAVLAALLFKFLHKEEPKAE
ncbi:MAG: aquaporin [Bacilli bacterium]|nr:aquaporin [Bacilli bacterium]